MNLYTPVSLKQQLCQVENEWFGEYKGFTLYSAFQPIFSKCLSEIYGYEGLVRVTKNGHSISPLAFFSEFTNETEIANIGALCASMHVRNFALARMQGKIFLNCHPTMFARVAGDQYSVDKAMERVALEGMEPENLVWEITEFKENDTGKFLAGLNAFRQTGSQIAIDDYGQLESNEARIALIKPDLIKIDRALIREFCEKKTAFLLELTEMLYNKGFKIVLEGVETPEEEEALKQIPHHFVQGFLYGKPCRIKV